jgi:hypothetical protein
MRARCIRRVVDDVIVDRLYDLTLYEPVSWVDAPRGVDCPWRVPTTLHR